MRKFTEAEIEEALEQVRRNPAWIGRIVDMATRFLVADNGLSPRLAYTKAKELLEVANLDHIIAIDYLRRIEEVKSLKGACDGIAALFDQALVENLKGGKES